MSLLLILSVLAVLAIALAGRVVFVEYPESAIDATRKQLFDLRDEHFDLARRGIVAFDNPGYLASRALINGMIRYAHDVSLLHLLAANLLVSAEVKRVRKAMNRHWLQEMGTLPKAAKEPVNDVLNQASAAMARLVVTRSLGLSSLFAIGAIVYCLATVLRKAKVSLTTRKNCEVVNDEREDHDWTARSNVAEAMEEAIAHGPMRRVPRLIAREARRYGEADAGGLMLQAA